MICVEIKETNPFFAKIKFIEFYKINKALAIKITQWKILEFSTKKKIDRFIEFCD
jgi:hypothetical protein